MAVPSTPDGLVGRLRRHAAAWPDKTALVFMAQGEAQTERLSYGGLDARARTLAARLQARGAAGGRVLILLPSGGEYVVAFVACLYAGAVPVPAYPPASAHHAQRVAAIAADCGAAHVLTLSSLLAPLRARGCGTALPLPAQRWLAVDEADSPGDEAAAWQAPAPAPQDLALLQYTSGSTGTPRGVMVTHANLLRHAEAFAQDARMGPADVFLTWLPLHHDMGLIAGVLQPLFVGASLCLMPPAAFLQRPMRWIEALSRHRATITMAPNFAYEICVPPAQGAWGGGAAPDLSALRIAFNAAEPVHADTLARFARNFAPCGLRPQALVPAYGLAEATLLACHPRQHADGTGAPAVLHLSAQALAQGRLQPLDDASRRGIAGVGHGTPLSGLDLRIVDPHTRRACASGEVGEIWLRGPTVAAGYWKQPGETAATFGARLQAADGSDGDGPFLRTGDLGALHGTTLHITGRLKDLIIVRGQNHHPADIEHTVLRAHEALMPGRIAAFAVEAGREERLVVLAELRRGERRQFDGPRIALDVGAAVAEVHGLQLHTLVLLRPASIAITSSGKIQRQACRRDHLAQVHAPLFVWQVPVQEAGPSSPPSGPAHDMACAFVDGLRGLAPGAAQRQLAVMLLDATAEVLNLPAARRAQLREGDFAQARLGALGLDSLGAVQLGALLKTRLGLEPALEDLLGADSVEVLARQFHEQLMMRWLSRQGPPGDDEGGTQEWTL